MLVVIFTVCYLMTLKDRVSFSSLIIFLFGYSLCIVVTEATVGSWRKRMAYVCQYMLEFSILVFTGFLILLTLDIFDCFFPHCETQSSHNILMHSYSFMGFVCIVYK